jgi:hypothetical protein
VVASAISPGDAVLEAPLGEQHHDDVLADDRVGGGVITELRLRLEAEVVGKRFARSRTSTGRLM